MPPTSPDDIIKLFLPLIFQYALPALALCAVLTVISAWIGKDRGKILKRRKQPALAKLKLTARRPLTQFEEKMFLRLMESLPECIVLAQVSFQALLDTDEFSERNRFDRKTADLLSRLSW